MAKQWNDREQLMLLVEEDPNLRRLYNELGYDASREQRANKILGRLKETLQGKSAPLSSAVEAETMNSLKELADVFDDFAPQGPKVRESVLNQLKLFPLELTQMPLGEALKRLDDEVKSAVARECSDDFRLNQRKNELDEHLRHLRIASYWFRYIQFPNYRGYYKERYGTMDRWSFWNLRPMVLDEARRYLRHEWMQRPGVKQVLLIALLQGELIKLTGVWKQAESVIPWFTYFQKAFGAISVASGFAYFAKYIPAGLIGLTGLLFLLEDFRQSRLRSACSVIEEGIDDVGSGNFDSEELARRLRNLEVKGLFVNTLIFSVLKACPATPVQTTE